MIEVLKECIGEAEVIVRGWVWLLISNRTNDADISLGFRVYPDTLNPKPMILSSV